MVELRWLDGILQYRSLRPSWLASGAWGEPSQWSEWEAVPNKAASIVAAEEQGFAVISEDAHTPLKSPTEPVQEKT